MPFFHVFLIEWRTLECPQMDFVNPLHLFKLWLRFFFPIYIQCVKFPQCFMFKFSWEMKSFSEHELECRHTNRCFKNCSIGPQSVFEFLIPISPTCIHNLCKDLLCLTTQNLRQPISLWMVWESHLIFHLIFFKQWAKKFIAKWEPPSLTMTYGVPNRVKIYLFKNKVTLLALLFSKDMDTHLDKWSTTTKIKGFLMKLQRVLRNPSPTHWKFLHQCLVSKKFLCLFQIIGSWPSLYKVGQ